ncbi:MAG: hypothetical protein SGARI_005454 [Bacillariaceae sp.]
MSDDGSIESASSSGASSNSSSDESSVDIEKALEGVYHLVIPEFSFLQENDKQENSKVIEARWDVEDQFVKQLAVDEELRGVWMSLRNGTEEVGNTIKSAEMTLSRAFDNRMALVFLIYDELYEYRYAKKYDKCMDKELANLESMLQAFDGTDSTFAEFLGLIKEKRTEFAKWQRTKTEMAKQRRSLSKMLKRVGEKCTKRQKTV